MSDVDELESSIRGALRRWAEEIPDAVPPPSSGRLAAAPRRAPAVKWAAAAAAAVLVAVVVSQQVESDKPSRLRTADAGATTTTTEAPPPHVPQEVRATTDTVVFRAAWGSGPQQLAPERTSAPPGADSPAGTAPTVPQDEGYPGPGPIAVAGDERLVFIADNANGRVVRVDTRSGRVDRTYPVGGVREMAVDPETGDLYTGTDDGVVSATTPGGETRRVFTAASTDEYPNLLQVTGARDEAGVYGTSYASKGLFRMSGPRITLPGWPVHDAYLSIGLDGDMIAAKKFDRGGNPVGSVRLLSEPDWKPGFPAAFSGAGGRFRVLVLEDSVQGQPQRTRLFDVNGTPAITAVYDVPTFRSRDMRVSAGALWALEITSSGAELHKVAIL